MKHTIVKDFNNLTLQLTSIEEVKELKAILNRVTDGAPIINDILNVLDEIVPAPMLGLYEGSIKRAYKN